MKIDEAITELNDDDIIYLGSQTGWFFIGTKEQYLDLEYALNRYLFKQLKDIITKDMAFVKSCFRKVMSDMTSCNKTMKKPEITMSRAADKYLQYFETIRRKKEFIPLQDREVLEFYQRIGEGWAVKIEGDEEARFWMKDEFDEAHELRNIESMVKNGK